MPATSAGMTRKGDASKSKLIPTFQSSPILPPPRQLQGRRHGSAALAGTVKRKAAILDLASGLAPLAGSPPDAWRAREGNLAREKAGPEKSGPHAGNDYRNGKRPAAQGGAYEALATRPCRASGMGKKRRRLAPCPGERRPPSGDVAAVGKGASWRKTVSGIVSMAPTAIRSSRTRPSNGAEASRTALFQPAPNGGGRIDAARPHPPISGGGWSKRRSPHFMPSSSRSRVKPTFSTT
jgi:hypothetical protein